MEQLPLAFEANAGQATAGTDYLILNGAMQAELSATQIRMFLPETAGQLSIRLMDARKDAPSHAADKAGESNYLLGQKVSQWRQHVQRYGRVTYEDVYPGIDLTYYGNGSRVEHDYVVHPGGVPSRIRLQLEGARKVDLTHSGDLRIALEESEVTLHQPHAYQVIDGTRHKVPAKFLIAEGAVSFRLGSYDRSLPLVIDPVLDYSTFLGNASVTITGVAVDASGNTYITGGAPNTYPANAQPATCSNCAGTNKFTVFVTKLNAAGTAVIYSTFIGGSVDPYNGPSQDQSTALAVDASGDVIVVGSADSSDFPLKNPISSAPANFSNGFVLSLTPDGSSLNFSSRLGGGPEVSQSDAVYPESVTTDTTGDVFVAGTSESTSLPVTPGALHAFSPSYGNAGAFLLKLSSTGSLSYGAIVGEIGEASGSTGPTGLAVDATGTVYMAGTAGTSLGTGNSPWPTTAGAYQSSLISPSENAPFVTRISADGSTILSSTLVGAGSVSSMSVTSSHDVLITGEAGYNFPVTPDAYSKDVGMSINGTGNPGAPGFLAKVSEDGTQLLYSSAFGPDGEFLLIRVIGQDPGGNVWIAGTSEGAIPLVNPLQSATATNGYSSGGGGFITEFDPAMHNVLFSGYVNSTTGVSQIDGMAIDSLGLAHVVGIASQDFPTTPGAVFGTVTPPPPNFTYAYGFVALIDASKPGPSICFANATEVIAQVGTTASGSFDIQNCGNGPLTISSVQLTSNVFAFASANVCTGSLAAGASCTLAYTFTPTTAGNFSAAVSIASNAPMAANLETISGTSTAPVASIFGGNPLVFDPQVLGTPPQTGTVSIQNTGSAPLVVNTSQTTITGPFNITSTSCSNSPVLPLSVCSYQIAFNPVTAGTATGALTIHTSDPVNPILSVAITGTALASFPVPALSSLSPATISLDSGPVAVSIIGTNFFPQSTVFVNGTSVPVTSESSTSIGIMVDPGILGALGEFPVQVVNPASGGPGNVEILTTFHVVNLNATQIVYEPVSKLIYAALPATSTTNPNTVMSLDPVTGKLGTPIPVLTNPTRLALSDDGHYAYVAFEDNDGASANYNPNGAMLERIDLTARAVDRTFVLPNFSAGVIDMHVVPGSPQLLVTSLSTEASPSENGVALFNDAGLVQYLPVDYSSYTPLDNFIFTSDPTTFYGYPIGSNGFFSVSSVSATGIASVLPGGVQCCDQATGSVLATDGTLLETNSGEVWDPKAQKLLGRYNTNLFYEAGIAADPVAKRTFILDNGFISTTQQTGDPQILSYDPSTFTLAGVLPFSLNNPPSQNDLLRWGSDGFAFRNNLSYPSDAFTNPAFTSQVILVRSSLANPPAAGLVTVSSLSPDNAAPGSPALTVTVSGSGFASDATVLWNGFALPTTFVSATQLTAAVPATDLAMSGTAQVTVSSGGTISTALPFIVGGPVVSLSTRSIMFPGQAVGLASPAQTLTVQNTGTTPLTGLAISISGINATSFATTSTCSNTLAVGSSCTVSVVFTPSAAGTSTATLTITDNAPDGPQSVTLTGAGVAPAFTLSSQSLSFGSVSAGTVTQQTVTLQNSGSIALTNIAITIAGQNASDFTGMSTCMASVAVNATCSLTVAFKPTSNGNESAVMTVTSAGAAPQSVNLDGTVAAPDFVLPPPTGGSSVTVPSGQAANLDFSVSTVSGFTGVVTMSCANLPAYATCTFTPPSFTAGSAATQVALSISTQQTVIASIRQRGPGPGLAAYLPALAFLFGVPAISRRTRQRLGKMRVVLCLLTTLSLVMSLNGCGGNSSRPAQTQQNTPAGSYNIMVIATSGALSHSSQITLIVQ